MKKHVPISKIISVQTLFCMYSELIEGKFYFLVFFIAEISLGESKKGAINIQRCSVENQKGTIAVQSLLW